MKKRASERRLAENEVVFRQLNEKVQKGFAHLKMMAKDSSQEELLSDNDQPLHFYCECSDENCQKRITVMPHEYDKIHQNRSRFVIVCGHEVKDVEHVVEERTEYCVVEKFMKPPKSADKSHKTDINNG